MKSIRSQSPEKNGFAGMKFLVGASLLSSVLVTWGLVDGYTRDNAVVAFFEFGFPEAKPPVGISMNIPPIPKLDPIPTLGVNFLKVENPRSSVVAVAVPVETIPTPPELRYVKMPAPAPIVQKVAPGVLGIYPFYGGTKKKAATKSKKASSAQVAASAAGGNSISSSGGGTGSGGGSSSGGGGTSTGGGTGGGSTGGGGSSASSK